MSTALDDQNPRQSSRPDAGPEATPEARPEATPEAKTDTRDSDPLPYLTADLPGTGGTLRGSPEDFRVEELPAYAPAGEGDHVFVWIEKRELTTPAAVDALARALGVRPADIGWAGMKDRHAVTLQWLSLPPPCTPEAVQDAVRAASVPGLIVHQAVRHRHKLRTGHLRGNRFTVRVRDTEVPAAEAAERARAVLARLARAPGAPNWFGAQRFGAGGDNAEQGRALLQGQRGGQGGRKPAHGRQKRFLISALQSELFNEYLRQRLADGLFDRVIEGDILQKQGSGGIFATTEPAVDQARLDAGEIVPTGPMFGHSMRNPPPDSAAAAREGRVLEAEELTLDMFRRVGNLGTGTRRPLAFPVEGTDVTITADGALEISFALPAGAYATALLREVVKGPTPFPG
jgi:tRNA pseudouridine13 synthase